MAFCFRSVQQNADINIGTFFDLLPLTLEVYQISRRGMEKIAKKSEAGLLATCCTRELEWRLHLPRTMNSILRARPPGLVAVNAGG